VNGGVPSRFIVRGVPVAISGRGGPEQAQTKITVAAACRNQAENLMLHSSDELG
jgi:hypothetical protein